MILKYRMSIDGYGCKNSRHLDGCNDFLTVLAQTLSINEQQRQLTGHSSPLAKQVRDNSGISAQVIFLESGLQLHVWPDKKEASVDIFSCSEFSKEFAKKAFERFFKPEKMEVWSRSSGEWV